MQKISTPPRSWAEVMAAAKVALACRQERCKQPGLKDDNSVQFATCYICDGPSTTLDRLNLGFNEFIVCPLCMKGNAHVPPLPAQS